MPKSDPSPLIPQRGREHLPRGDNGALGVREFIRVHGAEHAEHADDIFERAAAGEDRRGNGAQANFIFAVFHGKACLTAGGQGREQRSYVCFRVGREGCERCCTGEELGSLAFTHVGEDDLPLRGAVQRQPRPGRGDDAQAVAPLRLIKRDNVSVFVSGEHRRAAGLVDQVRKVGPRERRDVPEGAGAAAVFKKPQAKGVFPIGVLRDDVVIPHGGQKAEGRAFGQSCAAADVGERHRLAHIAQQLQQLHCLGNGADRVAVCHKCPS